MWPSLLDLLPRNSEHAKEKNIPGFEPLVMVSYCCPETVSFGETTLYHEKNLFLCLFSPPGSWFIYSFHLNRGLKLVLRPFPPPCGGVGLDWKGNVHISSQPFDLGALKRVVDLPFNCKLHFPFVPAIHNYHI